MKISVDFREKEKIQNQIEVWLDGANSNKGLIETVVISVK